MDKLNFVSNPRIMFFADGTEHEKGTCLQPDQIPSILIPGLCDAFGSDLILSLCIFSDERYENYVRVHGEIWDGVCTMRLMFKVFADGSSVGCADSHGATVQAVL